MSILGLVYEVEFNSNIDYVNKLTKIPTQKVSFGQERTRNK